MVITTRYPDYLSHHGIKGQKWGVRRFQNANGSLTEEGKARYAKFSKTMKATRESGMASRNAYLGRKMFAEKEQRIERGKELHERGRTELGAAGRAIGRVALGQFVAGAVSGAASVPAVMLMSNPATAVPAAVGYSFIAGTANATMWYQNISAVIRGAQDIRDLQTYKENKK